MSPLLAADLTYSWSQALADLSQIAAIATLVGFFPVSYTHLTLPTIYSV